MKLTKREVSMVKTAAAFAAIFQPMQKKATLEQTLANYGVGMQKKAYAPNTLANDAFQKWIQSKQNAPKNDPGFNGGLPAMQRNWYQQNQPRPAQQQQAPKPQAPKPAPAPSYPQMPQWPKQPLPKMASANPFQEKLASYGIKIG